jgi:hypothetical protein
MDSIQRLIHLGMQLAQNFPSKKAESKTLGIFFRVSVFPRFSQKIEESAALACLLNTNRADDQRTKERHL